MPTAATYASRAKAYWQTYLPSQFATIEDPEQFFLSLGQQVMEQVVEAGQSVRLPSTPDSRQLVAARQGAMLQAEEIAMADLVFLPPEPGTEERRLVGTVLPGWDEETPPA